MIQYGKQIRIRLRILRCHHSHLEGSVTAAAQQAVKIIQTKQARDISLTTYLMAMTGGILWGLYGWFEASLSIVFRNGVSLLMCASIIWLKLRHSGEPG